jgi:hypothetical protein
MLTIVWSMEDDRPMCFFIDLECMVSVKTLAFLPLGGDPKSKLVSFGALSDRMNKIKAVYLYTCISSGGDGIGFKLYVMYTPFVRGHIYSM